MNDAKPWVVLKFGGTSVANPANWPTIAKEVRRIQTEGFRAFIVCSALSKISNLLEQMLETAEAGGRIAPDVEQFQQRHRDFASAMQVDGEDLITSHGQRLIDLLRAPRNARRIPAWVHAEVMALGELLSTRLTARWLQQQGLATVWQDARQMLHAEPPLKGSSEYQCCLSAVCDYRSDEALQRALAASPDSIVVTQGFIASDEQGRTVLLGRGGSDTAASYFASKLDAARLEIWTDVPGVFTANPQQIPQARLLHALSYDEAETLAGMGAKVLHPRCIQPVREARIPLQIRWTARPEVDGTVICPQADQADGGVRAVSVRKDLCLIKMEKRAGWQPVGFMADVASCFKRHALSMDMVSSSPWAILATVDLAASTDFDEKLPALLDDLRKVCEPSIRHDVASISLVGKGLRSCMHDLGPTLEHLRDAKLLMLAHSANDLTFSFVVPRSETELMPQVHRELFEDTELEAPHGETWETLNDRSAEPAAEPHEACLEEAVSG